MMGAALLAVAACYTVVQVYFPAGRQTGEAVPGGSAAVFERGGPERAPVAAVGTKAEPEAAPHLSEEKQKPTASEAVPFDRDKVGADQGRWLAIVLASVIAVGFLVYRFSRPKQPEEAEDPTSFTDALQARSLVILDKCGTPREVRRFLNYLRLLATPTDERSGQSIQGLRARFSNFDRMLVDLATGRASHEDAVETFYRDQCEMFGLDPKTFQPLEQ